MKHLLITIIAAVLLVGCGKSQPPEPPSISICKATGNGNIEVVKQHLAAGTDVNAKNDVGRAPLHSAARNVNKEVVELLILSGANVNAADKNGRIPLDLSFIDCYTNTSALIRKHGGKMGEELKAEGK